MKLHAQAERQVLEKWDVLGTKTIEAYCNRLVRCRPGCNIPYVLWTRTQLAVNLVVAVELTAFKMSRCCESEQPIGPNHLRSCQCCRSCVSGG